MIYPDGPFSCDGQGRHRDPGLHASEIERDARLGNYRRAEALPEPASVLPIEGLWEGDSGTSGEGP